jgi:hypothetical protein
MSHNSAAQSAAAALESLNAGDSGVSAAHGQPELADQPAAPWLKVEEGGLAAGTEPDALPGPRNIVFVAWRDLANPRAGGSEVLVDKLAAGMAGRGHQVSLLCGGPSAPRPYAVVRSGGTYSQFVRAPLTYSRRLRGSDLVVEVCNGMPFLTPMWCSRPRTSGG